VWRLRAIVSIILYQTYEGRTYAIPTLSLDWLRYLTEVVPETPAGVLPRDEGECYLGDLYGKKQK
jgi:hypothetical protein